jgi:hypothetical protein
MSEPVEKTQTDANEVPRLEDELRAAMKRLIELDPNAITRIEKIFQKVRVERAVEKHLN